MCINYQLWEPIQMITFSITSKLGTKYFPSLSTSHIKPTNDWPVLSWKFKTMLMPDVPKHCSFSRLVSCIREAISSFSLWSSWKWCHLFALVINCMLWIVNSPFPVSAHIKLEWLFHHIVSFTAVTLTYICTTIATAYLLSIWCPLRLAPIILMVVVMFLWMHVH